MKTTLTAAILMMMATTAHAGMKENKEFAILSAISMAVVENCPKFAAVDNGAQVAADRNGIVLDKLGPAISAAYDVAHGRKYDRSELIPEVTVAVRNALGKFYQSFKESKSVACVTYADAVGPVGMIKVRPE